MDRPQPSPTLLVFTLGAKCESRRRQLLPATETRLEDGLHQACLEATITAGRAAGCLLEVSSPLDLGLPSDVRRRSQRGPDFGSRLERAVQESFVENGGPVILVGSDVPDLEAGHLHRTLRALEEDPDQVVIGPSPDGGFYLLASARPLGAVLSEVRWCCRETLRSLERALASEGRRVSYLPPLVDLDRRADLEQWLARGSYSRPWNGILRQLIARLGEILADLRRAGRNLAAVSARSSVTETASPRGPPLLATSS